MFLNQILFLVMATQEASENSNLSNQLFFLNLTFQECNCYVQVIEQTEDTNWICFWEL